MRILIGTFLMALAAFGAQASGEVARPDIGPCLHRFTNDEMGLITCSRAMQEKVIASLRGKPLPTWCPGAERGMMDLLEDLKRDRILAMNNDIIAHVCAQLKAR